MLLQPIDYTQDNGHELTGTSYLMKLAVDNYMKLAVDNCSNNMTDCSVTVYEKNLSRSGVKTP